ncbi:MAG: HTTM domain-containing protein, partial [Candidatus Omnitrophica bacterium]|nr:HTTM domain-containing protein [Candidatus Omnitrophota bacterium]
DIINGRTVEVPRLAGINAGSYLMMTSRPDMILQYARYLKERYRSQGIYAPLVTVNSFVSTDGRPFALFINPELNVAHSDIGVGHPLFINPAGWDQPGTGVLPQNVGKFFSAPYQLAVIDLEELLPGDHPLVKEMQGMMDILIDDQIISPIQVSNFVVELQQTLYIEYGRSYTTREILQALVDKYGRLGTMPEIKDVLTDFLKPRT